MPISIILKDGKDYREYYYENPEEYIWQLLNGTYDYAMFAAEAYSDLGLHQPFLPLGGDQYNVAAQALHRLANSVKNGGSWDPADVFTLLGVLYTSTGGGEFGGPFVVEGPLATIWGDGRMFQNWLKGNQSKSRINNPLTHAEASQILANAKRLGISIDINPAGLAGQKKNLVWGEIPHIKVGNIHIPVQPGFMP